jgi:hypothetical protein
MFFRLLAAVLAIVLLATTGGVGTLYLCAAHGGVHEDCCCKHAEAEGESEGTRVESADRCCEAWDSGATRSSAAALSEFQGESFQVLAAGLAPVAMHVAPRLARELAVAVAARAPPPRAGPALFVWNCSYLI